MVFPSKRYFRIFHEVIYKETGRKDVGGVEADRMIYGMKLQSQTILSSDPDATSLPSGENATAKIEHEWPSSVWLTSPVAVPQSLTVLSPDPDATSLPSCENATAKTQPEWPLSVWLTSPVKV